MSVETAVIGGVFSVRDAKRSARLSVQTLQSWTLLREELGLADGVGMKVNLFSQIYQNPGLNHNTGGARISGIRIVSRSKPCKKCKNLML